MVEWAFDYKRLAIELMSWCLIIISIVSLAKITATVSLILAAFILATALFGAIGAFIEDVTMLQIFLGSVTVLFVWEIVYLIVLAIIAPIVPIFDVILAIILSFTICFAADVVRDACKCS
jgi:ABC-type Na+ efflux pump permease subunit